MSVTFPRRTLLLGLSAVLLGTASCGLPRPGPNKREIFAGSVMRRGDAFVVTVDDHVARATAVQPALGFSSSFQTAGVVGSDTINPGDTLQLTIWENVDDGLLAQEGTTATQLTEVQVDGAGYIFVPYAGKIKAAGNSPDALRKIITEKLDAQTPDPQVLIARTAGDGATVSVMGSVGGQGVYAIERPTRTLSSMIARAGGVTIKPEITKITVKRGGKQGTVWLTDLYKNPKMDIALRPGDVILVEEDTRAFTSLGATGAQARVPFETQTLSALEAIATVGGLSSSTADPKGVFVFRNEPAEIARVVLGRNDLVGDQRMVYVLNLTEPNGMFLARDFVIRDGDTVYVTEAPFVQWQKSLSALTGSATAANSINNVASGN
ncbi:polysaccharide biosynthesis/export family protein [Rhodobacter capsulatus]|uniref:Polysaccharide biosynthesis/export protein family n=1 Tax=Rhodobacter capsulatus (strain ATCC BAA-309 / NBRC 16581 / SB1003) TaxID=272942 RepID=D5AQL3_RHOCB|nr:polysaccharide biosynthesis/export protein family [Rhodobacter capsulatus SB 1003]ETD00348.1 sugar ABC transporter substrate-binding protein [Rhodobacter capsulatus DE442]ETD74688.1 sugar ABC transporter substrate-binding protein [Rhodobacter capsulatus R121]ETE52554.1 sugar ABC transporter substrate-binding protein [Rhodobacter capsulatus Y262]